MPRVQPWAMERPIQATMLITTQGLSYCTCHAALGSTVGLSKIILFYLSVPSKGHPKQLTKRVKTIKEIGSKQEAPRDKTEGGALRLLGQGRNHDTQ